MSLIILILQNFQKKIKNCRKSRRAGIVEYLISKKSSYVTGQDFIIDGGWLSKGL